ncbi:unnamed protein product [Spirodela intermedia]|uniref:Uncharacterized protein n=1 Tax=Spirodela intermedia TaxID=51605 RepID=A0A7I8JLM9_SPIIN|nr:unnamed protein product [Spirodela intermedia]CAA6671087.1 unnamed protein product [Spirodela intermedia]
MFQNNGYFRAQTRPPREDLIKLAEPVRRLLAGTPYETPPGDAVSVKSMLESLLPPTNLRKEAEESGGVEQTRDFCLCCAALASAEGEETPHLYWIPKELSRAGRSALSELSDYLSLRGDREFVCALMPSLLPSLKTLIKDSCVDAEADDVVASSPKTPVIYAIVSAHQFRWLVTQVSFPYLGELCPLVIPCALTTLDHWSPEVKGPGVVTFIHLAKNVNSAELAWYEEPILDACCRNIASSDILWDRVLEMSVLLLTCVQRGNPRSPWYEQILSEMLGHLERQATNKERRIHAMGLLLLAHFKRIFSLLFQWLHADDDETLVLVLERIHTIAKVTWIRKSPFILRLIDELVPVFKSAAVRKEREAIRSRILQIFSLLRACHVSQFDAAWERHSDDPDLADINPVV